MQFIFQFRITPRIYTGFHRSSGTSHRRNTVSSAPVRGQMSISILCRVPFGTVTQLCGAVEFVRSGFRSRRRAALRWMLKTTRRPASRNVGRAAQTGIRSEFRFVGVQVPSWENGAQADFLCGTERHGQITGAVRVISLLPGFRADGRLQRVDTFRIDLCQEVSGCISMDDLADCRNQRDLLSASCELRYRKPTVPTFRIRSQRRTSGNSCLKSTTGQTVQSRWMFLKKCGDSGSITVIVLNRRFDQTKMA